MDVVVRVLPRLLGRGGVPVPHARVDHRIVHPVPLTVHHVMADLHVLEDLGQREHDRPRQPSRRKQRRQQQHPAADRELAVKRDQTADVARVAVAKAVEHLVMQAPELATDLFDLLRRQPLERICDLHRNQHTRRGQNRHTKSAAIVNQRSPPHPPPGPRGRLPTPDDSWAAVPSGAYRGFCPVPRDGPALL